MFTRIPLSTILQLYNGGQYLLAEEAGAPVSAVNIRYTFLYQAIQVHIATGTNRTHEI